MGESEFWCMVYGKLYGDVVDDQRRPDDWSREDCAKWAGATADVALAEAKARGHIVEKSGSSAARKRQ